jgi:hypothetical protein
MEYPALPGGRPVGITIDYVQNLGGAVPEDTGWSVSFSLGELSEVGDWRLGYGYAVAETDAVLAAFSQDNTTYATNYRAHGFSADYLLADDVFLNLTGHFYRRENSALAPWLDDDDWVSRARINVQFTF